MRVSWKPGLAAMMAGALALVLLLGAGIGSAAAPDPQLSDDLVFIGNAGGNNIKVVDVNSQSVVNTVGGGTSMNKNHGVLMDGDPRYVWTANDGVVGQKLKVVKFDLGTLSETVAYEHYVPGYSGSGLCGIEYNQNDPSKNIWTLAMSAAPGQGGAWEVDPDSGFTGNYVDPGMGTDNRATCGIGWNAAGTMAYASLMVAKKTTELSWPGGPTGRASMHNPMLHIMDTNKEAGLAYVAGGNADGVGSSLEVVDMATMTVVGRTPLEGYNPHSVTLAHDNSFIYAHSRIGAPDGTGILLVLDSGGGAAGGTMTNPVLIAAIPDQGTGGSCGNDVAKKSDYCSRPDLSLSQVKAYWANLGDYGSRILSVDYSVANNSALAAAHNMTVTGTTNTNGVTMAGSSPGGNIPGGSSPQITIKYNVPLGVKSFNSTIQMTASDLCTNPYSYSSGQSVAVPLLPDAPQLPLRVPEMSGLSGLPVLGSLLGGGSGLPLVGDLLGGGSLPDAGDLGGTGGLPIAGDFLGGLPIVGDLLGGAAGSQYGSGLPLMGDVLGGSLPLMGDAGLPVAGDLGGTGGLPILGDFLGGGNDLPIAGDVLGGSGLPVVGDVLGGGLPVVGDVIGGGEMPLVGDILGGDSTLPVVDGLLGLLLGL